MGARQARDSSVAPVPMQAEVEAEQVVQKRDHWKSFESFGFDRRPQLPRQIFPSAPPINVTAPPNFFRPHEADVRSNFLLRCPLGVSIAENLRLTSQTVLARAHQHKAAMIASTTTAMLRSGVTRGGCSLQPILLRSTTSCPYSTITAASPFASVRSKLSDSKSTTTPAAAARPSSPILTLRRQPATTSPAAPAGRRHASSSSARDNEADVAAATRAAQRAEAYARSNPDMPPLDWNSFFQLRKTRRRWQVGFSALMSVGFGAAGALVLGSGAADALTGQIPLDPILTLGLITLGCTAMGWVVGPSLGNAVFYLIKHKYKAPMTVVRRSAASLSFQVERASG